MHKKTDSDSINLPPLKGHTGLILIHGPADLRVVWHGATTPMIQVTVLAGPVISLDTCMAPPVGPRVNGQSMLAGIALHNP